MSKTVQCPSCDRIGTLEEFSPARDKSDDLFLIASAFFDNLTIDKVEYGAIGVDCKRPFGNSDVEHDMLEIIEWEPESNDGVDYCYSEKQREYVRDLYFNHLIPYLQQWWEDAIK